MDNQQNESNTLIAWIVGAVVTLAIAIALVFSAVGVMSGGKKTEAAAPAAPAAAAPATESAPAAEAPTAAPTPSESGQAPAAAGAEAPKQ